MKNFTVSLSLSAEQLKCFYAGQVGELWARDVTGVSLRFPLASLQPFIGHSGRLLVILELKGIFGCG